jgi:hypothetical protein
MGNNCFKLNYVFQLNYRLFLPDFSSFSIFLQKKKLFYQFYKISYFCQWVLQILASIAHNVPAVYDVLAARISKHVVFAGPTKCGGGLPWEWSAAE